MMAFSHTDPAILITPTQLIFIHQSRNAKRLCKSHLSLFSSSDLSKSNLKPDELYQSAEDS